MSLEFNAVLNSLSMKKWNTDDPRQEVAWQLIHLLPRQAFLGESSYSSKCQVAVGLGYCVKGDYKDTGGMGPSHCTASLEAQRVKHLPSMWETWVWSLGWEDPLEKEKATHSGTLVWKIPWTEKPGRLQSIGSQSQTRLSDFTALHRQQEESNKMQASDCCISSTLIRGYECFYGNLKRSSYFL